MANLSVSGSRPLTVPESRAFMRLALTPGHWGALVVAPLIPRGGPRGRVPLDPIDFKELNRLRVLLPNARAPLAEAEALWGRVAAGLPSVVIETAQRMFAWHLSTDLTYAERLEYYGQFWSVLEYFSTRPTNPLRTPNVALKGLYRIVDQYLPVEAFDDTDPGRIEVPKPPPAVLVAVGQKVSPSRLTWPAVSPTRAPALLPATARLLGPSIRDWWCRPEAPRLAAATGLAGRTFDERERLYAELEAEWTAACRGGSVEAEARSSAERFVGAVREWVDGVRSAVRLGRRVWGDPRRAPEPDRGAVPASVPFGPAVGVWRCPECGTETPTTERRCSACRAVDLPRVLELHSSVMGKGLKVGDGGQVGRSEYRSVFGDVDAGLAAADQFQLVRDVARGAWRVVPVGAPLRRTMCNGNEVPPEGTELAEGSVISVAGALPLTVRFK
jgi:hypothetical protein